MTMTELPAAVAPQEGFRALGTAAAHDLDDGRHEVVLEFPHDVVDSYKTSWRSGCFDDSLSSFLPPFVWNHDANDLIGRAVSFQNLGNRTQIVNRFSDFDAVPRARQVFAQFRDGDIPGCSFHFRNGESQPHPNVRGAREYTKARILETSGVVFPSIPGAKATGLRTEEGAVTPTITELKALLEDGTITEAGYRSALAEHYPTLREHITVARPKFDEAALAAVRAQVAETYGPEAAQSLVIAGQEGTTGVRDDEDSTDLIQSVDAALDAMQTLVDDQGDEAVRSLPDWAQQALAYSQSAGTAIDEAMEVMGIDDPDEDGSRAGGWDPKEGDYSPAQWKSACLIDTGTGDPEDKARYKLPVKDPDGSVNAGGLESANKMFGHVKGVGDDVLQAAAKKLMSLLSDKGIKPSASVLAAARGGSDDDGDDGDGDRSDPLAAIDAVLERAQRLVTKPE